MKKVMATMLLAAVALTGAAQTKIRLQGIAPAEATTVYLFSDLDFRNKIDSVAVADGQWTYESERPADQTLVAMMTDVTMKHEKMEEMAVIMVDEVPTSIDLTRGVVEGSKASEAMNNAVKGLFSLMQTPYSEGHDPKMEAFKLMRKAVLDNLDSMLPVHFVPMLAEGLTQGDLQKILSPDTPFYHHPAMESAKQRLAFLSNDSPRSIGKAFTDLVLSDPKGNEHPLSQWCGKGRYVLIDFWASWCRPCRAEMPNVVQNYRDCRLKQMKAVGTVNGCK